MSKAKLKTAAPTAVSCNETSGNLCTIVASLRYKLCVRANLYLQAEGGKSLDTLRVDPLYDEGR